MTQVIEPVRYDLSTAISVKKKKMVELGMKYGLADKRTIKCSQQLDELLNRYTSVKHQSYEII
ncbi:aspartyl-phosphate phosphatase Spo0E family protein [Halobacillus shinanisalinarum]|uniref:Aspartyl-phosphate phosphatase Spo0E family protein n=1 Tax=Halobacillus shinanisalinarum TaxID=2932258 RepID=A0ABY4H596_9BACI|nr:aspartyl-phosphate phosphatase Spo0E family protein [Halobacillus shinanisalinarum]UOQ95328.1 aspartyl-phosphate phosphatase Spo0E family protein [Halobacillus shinanisalinarum]